jgi:chromosome segregation ATPase
MVTVQRIESGRDQETVQLVDRMDTAIGEASASIGVVMSELVRRSLRGGVNEIGESIHEYAREQVSVAIDDMLPSVTRAVEELAETTSHRVAFEATEKLSEEVRAVEVRTNEKSQLIATKFKEEADAAIAVVQFAVTDTRTRAESTATDLENLHQRAKESWKKLQLELQEIHEVESKNSRGLTEANQFLQTFRQQFDSECVEHQTTRKQVQATDELLSETRELLMSARQQLELTLSELQATRNELSKTDSAVSAARQELNTTMKDLSTARLDLSSTKRDLAQTQAELVETRRHLQQTGLGLQQARESLKSAAEELRVLTEQTHSRHQTMSSRCDVFAARLEELERPKGLRALFSKISGGTGKAPSNALSDVKPDDAGEYLSHDS